MNQPDKEASKRTILNSVSEMDTLVTHPKDDAQAYHHANAILTQVIVALLAYTDDEEVYKAVDDLLNVHQVIADRIGVRPHIYAVGGEEENEHKRLRDDGGEENRRAAHLAQEERDQEKPKDAAVEN